MNININSNNYSKRCLNPNFTAQLKGSAVRMAAHRATEGFELGEIGEILDNVSQFGDRATIINCGTDGIVSVSNDNFGNFVHRFKLDKNEKAKNPFLELLRNFNSDNGILKVEFNFFDSLFKRTKTLRLKQEKYKLYSSMPVSVSTKSALDAAAKKNGIIKDHELAGKTQQDIKNEFEKIKAMFIASFEKKGI